MFSVDKFGKDILYFQGGTVPSYPRQSFVDSYTRISARYSMTTERNVSGKCSDVNDLDVVNAAKTYNNNQTSVMTISTDKLLVIIDWHGLLVACGYPDRNAILIVERRWDFNDVVHSLPQSISSVAMKNVVALVARVNMERAWGVNEGMTLAETLQMMANLNV